VGHSFFSAGISKSEGFEFPQNVINLAKSWNLSLDEKPNQDLIKVESLLSNAELIICVDDFVFDYCKINISDKQLMNLSEFATKFGLTIYDPINLQMSQFKTMISKYIFLTNEFMHELEGIQKNLITIIPNDFDELNSSFNLAINLAGRSLNPVIIDYNLRVPNIKLTQISEDRIFIINENLLENLKPSSSTINTFGREITDPESRYLDYSWRQKIHSLSDKFKVILVMPPRKFQGEETHDSFLASLTR